MSEVLGIALVLLLAFTVHAEPPDRASVERVLSLSKAAAVIESSAANLEQVMRQTMQQATTGQKLTAAQKKIVDELPAKFAALVRDELAWDKLKPQYIQIYQETFDQTEVDRLIAFYQTPLGQALIDKLPALTMRATALVQVQMQTLLPKIQAVVKQTMDEIKRVK